MAIYLEKYEIGPVSQTSSKKKKKWRGILPPKFHWARMISKRSFGMLKVIEKWASNIWTHSNNKQTVMIFNICKFCWNCAVV